jgi:hypothetical protein
MRSEGLDKAGGYIEEKIFRERGDTFCRRDYYIQSQKLSF